MHLGASLLVMANPACSSREGSNGFSKYRLAWPTHYNEMSIGVSQCA